MSAPQRQTSQTWLTIAAAIGAPVAAYLLYKSCTTDWFSQPIRETDFDSFLVAQGAHPTGLDPSKAPSKKKKKKSALAASERGKVSGPFETFLKQDPEDADADSDEEEDVRNPLDFNSFLKTAQKPKQGAAGANSSAKAASAKAAPAAPKGPSADQARVLVMFGTEFGFSKEIAEKLCTRLTAAKKYWPVLVDMAEHPEGYDLTSEQAVFMACSTQGDGVPPSEAREFCEWLFANKAGNLSHLMYSVIALGDRSYTHFCRCGKQLDAALSAAGAKQLVDRVDVHKEDWAAVDGWIESVAVALASVTLKPIGDAAATAATKTDGHAAAPKRWGKSRPYPGRVVAVEGLCAVTSKDDKNTFRVEVDLGTSGLSYAPGDALGIYPTNGPQYVDELLRVLGTDGTQTVPTPPWHYEMTPPASDDKTSTNTHTAGPLTLRDALSFCYDLKTPKAELFQLLWQALPASARDKAEHSATANGTTVIKANGSHANGTANGTHANGNGTVHVNGSEKAHAVAIANGHHTNGETNGKLSAVDTQAASLWSLVSGGSSAQEAYMSVGRHVVDVLKEFSAASLTTTQVVSCLRQLQPRLYSISSSPKENTTRVQATIAEVKYNALGAERIGVCSTYVSERIKVGQCVYVYVHKNPDFRLPPSPSTPIIMVGPGTGLAPFRSFILERLIDADTTGTAPGEMVLYFGCRRSDQDYLYGADLERWAQEGRITLHTAFSRQQAQKVYVQDRLLQQADAVWRLLDQHKAHFYVCGDAANMAGAVERALLSIIGERIAAAGGEGAAAKPADAAQAYLDELSRTGRYQRDVWY